MLKDHVHGSNLAATLGMITQKPGNVSAHTHNEAGKKVSLEFQSHC